jgi:SWI/SNF-related matrix-associated actin-dependent regulator 1 of chromatin subfamily A
VPGVYENKYGTGYRVPLNAHSLLGLGIPPSLERSIGILAMAEALASPWLVPTVPGMLRDYQRASIQHVIHLDGGHIWIPPGGGKTLCALVWLCYEPLDLKLVVCKAAGRSTWADEIRKWTKFEPVLLLGHTPDASVFENYSGKVFILGWETAIHWKDCITKAKAFTRIASLVMDETHTAKASRRSDGIIQPDGSTKWEDRDNLTAAAAALSKHALRRLGLTGTPVPNRIRDLWAQLDLMEPWAWGGFRSFGMRYCGAHHNGYGWTYDGYSNGDELKTRLRFCTHRVAPSTVRKELPPKTRIIQRVPIEEQDTPATGFAHAIRTASKSGDSDGLHEALLQEAATRKRRIVVGHILAALKNSQKVVVFTGRHRDCDVLGESVASGIKQLKWDAIPTLWVSHGGHSIDSRDKIRREYMGDATVGRSPHAGPCVLVGTGDAWGESINLQDTDLAIIVQLPWMPKQLEQWEQRFQRLGGTRPVTILYIVAEHTVDEDIMDNLLGKLPPIEDVVTESGLAGIEESFRPVPTTSLLERVIKLASPTTE